jgi:hypothetical protein
VGQTAVGASFLPGDHGSEGLIWRIEALDVDVFFVGATEVEEHEIEFDQAGGGAIVGRGGNHLRVGTPHDVLGGDQPVVAVRQPAGLR